MTRRARIGALCAGLVLGGAPAAQELFLRNWSTRDGLVHDRVNATLEDSQGYLWIATWEGLSRFDGRGFESFGTPDGLPAALVFALAEDPEGRLWAAPNTAGLARFDDDARAGEPRFRTFRVGPGAAENKVDAILFDARGMWVGTSTGVWRASAREEPRFEPVWSAPAPPWDLQAFLRHGERGWIVSAEQALELTDAGVRELPGPGGAPPRDSVNAWPTAEGRALIVTTAGLFVFDAAAAEAGREPWQRVPFELAPEEVVHATAIDARGRMFVAGIHGLLVLDGGRVRRLTAEQGLGDDWLRSLSFDRAGTLWIGTNLAGLVCLREPAIATFLGPGRERMNVVRVVQAADGALLATANDRGALRLGPDGLVPIPGSEVEPFRNVHVRLLQDRAGDWWLATRSDAWRVRGPELEPARAERISVEGGGGVLGELFQEASGRLLAGSDEGLFALDPAAADPRFTRVLASAELGGAFPRTFQADGAGTLWISTNEGLFRLADGAARRVVPRGALTTAQLQPRALLLDSRGTLWVGTRNAGLAWTREPSAAEPVFERLSVQSGLPSDHVAALAEDELGHVWLGTGRGLVRLDPASGALRRFGTPDGLAGEMVNALLCDRDGTLWAGCAGGLARVDPRVEPAPSPPPPIHLRRFEAGGRAVPLPGPGRLGGLELAPEQRALALAFTGIDLAHGETLRYEHRLEGLESDWSESVQETSVRYGSLAPGTYRFLVRARTYDGVASAEPAVVEFRLLAPLWRRPWFAGLAAGALGVLGWSVQRVRTRRTRALERIRSQIATDLHDEVGSNLAQIAVLTEVARREGAGGGERLREVAELARETRSAMADLVWAIDPRRDTLADLVQRLRSVTANLLGAEGVELVLRVPGEGELDGLALAPDRRRHLLFFLKEAIHNVERHAAAQRVEVELALEPERLRLAVRDDGRGFDTGAPSGGHGLASLRARARELGATLRIESEPGRGTRIELLVPV